MKRKIYNVELEGFEGCSPEEIEAADRKLQAAIWRSYRTNNHAAFVGRKVWKYGKDADDDRLFRRVSAVDGEQV